MTTIHDDVPKRMTSLSVRETLEIYDKLGLEWSSFELGWEGTRKTMKGAHNRERKLGKDYKNDNGVHIYLPESGLEVIDLDEDNEHTRHIMKLAKGNCNYYVKTRKGYHLYFKSQQNFKHTINTTVHIDLLTDTGNAGAILICPPSQYMIDDKKALYQLWVYPQKDETIMPMPETLIDYLRGLDFKKYEGTLPKKASDPDDMPPLPAPPPPSLTEVVKLCDCLTGEWLADFQNWMKLAFCLKNISDTDEMANLFLDVSARGTGYSGETARTKNYAFWRQINPAKDGKKRLTAGSLKHWAKNCDPHKYFNNAKGNYLRLIQPPLSSNALCELFINEMAGDIMFSVTDTDFFVYDPATTLWKRGQGVRAIINSLFVEICHSVLSKLLADVPVGETDEDRKKNQEQRKYISKIMTQQVNGSSAVNLVKDFLPSFCIPDEDPVQYFDANPDLLPLINGVWKFSESRLVPYEREHYFTHKITIAFNARADTSLIERAMNDWFKKDAELIAHLQMLIGYFLTGYTNRQEFYIAWGTSAGNGKSLLWGEILPSLLSTKYYSRITSDAFAVSDNPNNEQIYDLNVKRYAFMSEPKKGLKKGTAVDNEVIKAITGDSQMTAQKKYKNAITFNLTVKVMTTCNELPEYNVDDNGMMRRLAPFEQNTPCLDEADYNAVPAHIRNAGGVIKKDDAFIKALLADREGTLRWALEGAKRYMENPRAEPPASMKNAKTKARNNIDALGQWLTGNLEKGKKNLPFSAIKNEWKSKNLNFDQTKRGFNEKLADKIRLLGFEVDMGRPGKAEEKIIKCALVPDNIDNELEN